MKIDAGLRELAGERGALETRKAWRVLRTESVLTFVGLLDCSFQHVRYGVVIILFDPDTRERILR